MNMPYGLNSCGGDQQEHAEQDQRDNRRGLHRLIRRAFLGRRLSSLVVGNSDNDDQKSTAARRAGTAVEI